MQSRADASSDSELSDFEESYMLQELAEVSAAQHSIESSVAQRCDRSSSALV